MKKTLAAAAVFAIVCSSALAADLPVQSYQSPPVVAQVYNWTGLYVGVNGGYGWGTQDPLILFSNAFDRSSFNINGEMFGGTVGAQIQQGYVVLGLEGDLDWANIAGNGISNPSILGVGKGITLNIATNTSAIMTARLRTGVAMNNWLFYVTGGVAFDKSSASGTSIAGVACGTAGVFNNCSASSWRPGLAAGLGFEYGFAQNWSAKLEYLYIATAGSGVGTDHIDTIRAGINYQFSKRSLRSPAWAIQRPTQIVIEIHAAFLIAGCRCRRAHDEQFRKPLMFKSFIATMLVGLVVLSAPSANAQTMPTTSAGTLTCQMAPSIGLIIGSRQRMACRFVPNGPYPPEAYVGVMGTLGLDIGITAGGVLAWGVLAPTAGPMRGKLAGTYVGASGAVGVGVGVGANLLFGGSNRSIALQPLSVEGSVGVNLSLGVSSLTLALAQ